MMLTGTRKGNVELDRRALVIPYMILALLLFCDGWDRRRGRSGRGESRNEEKSTRRAESVEGGPGRKYEI